MKRHRVPKKRFDVAQATTALRKIKPEYRGWVASVLWYHHAPKGKDSPSPTRDAGWAKFKSDHVPVDISLDLSADVMLKECNKISLAFSLQNAQIRTLTQNASRRDIDPSQKSNTGYDLRSSEDYYTVPGARQVY